jgi:hypothetical protein
MSRAIDICTCSHDRNDHAAGDLPGPYSTACAHVGCWCPQFFPHPQPEREAFAPAPAMPKLKFKLGWRGRISLVEAAEILVINNDPMPSRVRCSVEDWVTTGCRGESLAFMLQLPENQLARRTETIDPMPYHKFEIVPDTAVPEGEVCL